MTALCTTRAGEVFIAALADEEVPMHKLIAWFLPSALIALIFSPYIPYWYQRTSAMISWKESTIGDLLVTLIVALLALATWFAIQSPIAVVIKTMDQPPRAP